MLKHKNHSRQQAENHKQKDTKTMGTTTTKSQTEGLTHTVKTNMGQIKSESLARAKTDMTCTTRSQECWMSVPWGLLTIWQGLKRSEEYLYVVRGFVLIAEQLQLRMDTADGKRRESEQS